MAQFSATLDNNRVMLVKLERKLKLASNLVNYTFIGYKFISKHFSHCICFGFLNNPNLNIVFS